MSETQQVWDEFSSVLRQFLRKRVRDEHVADDLLQDVFVRIHDKLDTVTDTDRLRGWIFRVARSVVADYYRRGAADGQHDVPAVEAEPDESNLNELVGGWLMDRVAALPQEYGDAVRLVELEGIRQTEVADRLGLSPTGARSRVQRGRRMLKDLLLECCHFEFDRRGNVIDYEARSCCRTCLDQGRGGAC